MEISSSRQAGAKCRRAPASKRRHTTGAKIAFKRRWHDTDLLPDVKTLRQKMIALLQASSMDRRDLSQALRISEKEVDGHLPHVGKTVAAQGMTWQVTPAFCDNCQYTFKDRKRCTPPSKCPKCKASRIQGPWFKVIGDSI